MDVKIEENKDVEKTATVSIPRYRNTKRRTLVSFSDATPAKSEYFDELARYNTWSPWTVMFMLLGITANFIDSLNEVPLSYGANAEGMDASLMRHLDSSARKTILCDTEKIDWSRQCETYTLLYEFLHIRVISVPLGAVTGGIMADLYGRKFVIWWLSIVWFALACIKVVIPSLLALKIIYGLESAVGGIVQRTTFVLCLEIIHKKLQIPFVVAIFLGYVLAYSFADVTAKGFHRWHHYQIVSATMLLPFIFLGWYVPESPKWLWAHLRRATAFKILAEIKGERTTSTFNVPYQARWCILRTCFRYLCVEKFRIFVIVNVLCVIYGAGFGSSMWSTNFVLDGKNTKYVALLVYLSSSLIFLPVYTTFGVKYGCLSFQVGYCVVNLAAVIDGRPKNQIYFDSFTLITSYCTMQLFQYFVVTLFPTFVRAIMIGFVNFTFYLAAYSHVTILNLVGFQMSLRVFYATQMVISLLGGLLLLLKAHKTIHLPNPTL